MFKKRELLHLGASAVILGLVFAWDDGMASFDPTHWFANFIKILILVIIAIFVHQLAHKRTAHHFDAEAEYEVIGVQRFWFKGKLKKPFPVWAFVALLLTITSAGKLFFTAIGTNKLKPLKHRRTGRKFLELTGTEEALILLSGPLANILLILLLNVVGKALGTEFNNFITINLVIALWYMVPLPGFDGNGIYFGSRYLYLFGLSFIVLAFLLKSLNLFWTVLLSIIIAAIVVVVYWWREQE